MAPVGDPFVKKFAIVCFHQLKAAFEPLINPTRHVLEPVGSESATIAETRIHENRVLVLEMLDDHVK